MTMTTSNEYEAVVWCDLPGCIHCERLRVSAAEDAEYSVALRILPIAAWKGWAMYDSRAVCPSHVREFVLAANESVAEPPILPWGDGHRFQPRSDRGFGCERCGRGPCAPVHGRDVSGSR